MKLLLNLRSSRLSPMLSYRNFIVVCVPFEFLIPVELILGKGMKPMPGFIAGMWALFVGKTTFSTLWPSLLWQWSVDSMRVCFFALYSGPLIYFPSLLPILCHLYDCGLC